MKSPHAIRLKTSYMKKRILLEPLTKPSLLSVIKRVAIRLAAEDRKESDASYQPGEVYYEEYIIKILPLVINNSSRHLSELFELDLRNRNGEFYNCCVLTIAAFTNHIPIIKSLMAEVRASRRSKLYKHLYLKWDHRYDCQEDFRIALGNPITVAMTAGNLQVLRILLHNARFGEKLIDWQFPRTTREGHSEVVQFIINSKYRPWDEEIDVSDRYKYKNTFFKCLITPSMDILESLLNFIKNPCKLC